MVLINKFISLSLATILFASCVQKQKTSEPYLASGDCQKALYEVEKDQSEVTFLEQINKGSGKTLYYTALSTGYAVEVVIIAGIVVAVAGLCKGGCNLGGGGFSGGGGRKYSSSDSDSKRGLLGIAEFADQKSRDVRCPHFNKITDALMDVSKCYRSKQDHKTARQILASLTKAEDFRKCSSKERVEIIENQIGPI